MWHDKNENSIEVDGWMAQNLWNFWRPTQGWRDVLHNIWKHLTLLVFCASACHIHVGKNLGNDEGNGEMAIASLGGLALGTGQLDRGQQDQALSILETCIGFKCPPVDLTL